MTFYRELPKTMPIKERRDLVEILKEIRRDAKMENSDFPQEVKDTIRLHHQTWIIDPLDLLIKRYEIK